MAQAQSQRKKKILAVASIGGHWVELLRITRALERRYDVEYMCTNPDASSMIGGRPIYLINDFNRWSIMRLFPAIIQAFKALIQSRPDAVITTGAAPGLVTLTAARMMGIKTIWVDSIANAAHLSGSGKVAARIAGRVYTQSPQVAHGRVKYRGNIFN